MSCPGLHCASCSGGSAAPVLALAALEGFTWVAAHLVEVAMVSAACGALSVAAVVALLRWCDRRDARQAARGPLMVTRAQAVPLPPPARREMPPVVNIYIADPGTAARVIRQVANAQLPPARRDQGTA